MNLLDLWKPSALAFDAEKFARCEDAQAADRLPEQVAEVAPVGRAIASKTMAAAGWACGDHSPHGGALSPLSF